MWKATDTISDDRYVVFNRSEYAILILLNEYAVLDRKLDTADPMVVDTPYRFIDQNNIRGKEGVEHLKRGKRGFQPERLAQAQIRRIFLDGYDVLVVRTYYNFENNAPLGICGATDGRIVQSILLPCPSFLCIFNFIVYAAIRANGMVAKVLAISDVAPRHLSPTLRHHTIFTRHYLARRERKEQKDNPFSNVTV
ncbi:hypothetical protein Tco_1335156 [Tanacetum coccineum]